MSIFRAYLQAAPARYFRVGEAKRKVAYSFPPNCIGEARLGVPTARWREAEERKLLMRLLVEPTLAGRCDCGGELLFKLTMPDDPAFDMEAQIFVCVACGRERLHRVIHDRYAAHTASKTTPTDLA